MFKLTQNFTIWERFEYYLTLRSCYHNDWCSMNPSYLNYIVESPHLVLQEFFLPWIYYGLIFLEYNLLLFFFKFVDHQMIRKIFHDVANSFYIFYIFLSLSATLKVSIKLISERRRNMFVVLINRRQCFSALWLKVIYPLVFNYLDHLKQLRSECWFTDKSCGHWPRRRHGTRNGHLNSKSVVRVVDQHAHALLSYQEYRITVTGR